MTTIINSDWERIKIIFEYSQEKSINAFAKLLGIARAENLYQIKRGKNRISRDLADMIVARYPELSKAWILTGEGEMLMAQATRTDLYGNIISIPFYDNFPYVKPPFGKRDKLLYFSRECVADASFATTYRGDELAPRLKSGSILFLKEWNLDAEFIYGESYFILTRDFGVYRIVRKLPERDKILLSTFQPTAYDDMIVSRSEIQEAYRICGANII